MTEDSIRGRSLRTLGSARANYEDDPSLANTVWYGRVVGFRYRMDEAIAVFGEGLERYPDSFELLRQRGDRYLSTRRFAEGQADLARAAELIEGRAEWIEPDGKGNELPVPATSVQFNTCPRCTRSSVGGIPGFWTSSSLYPT